jgi:hypothetical protein
MPWNSNLEINLGDLSPRCSCLLNYQEESHYVSFGLFGRSFQIGLMNESEIFAILEQFER